MTMIVHPPRESGYGRRVHHLARICVRRDFAVPSRTSSTVTRVKRHRAWVPSPCVPSQCDCVTEIIGK
ncbi:hypothetical protein BIFBIF_00679 [Bifidobacterium bifidum ATCC 29521 = JCM 1255 = DSM 20456]|nr:hypothetical protein BIFBIF_00679 [Bifidobacterium bifidum ATCC 29521 = JCM 1255 = DSM 20456]